MNKKQFKIILGFAFGILIVPLLAAMLDFHPFVGDDLVVREIQFCTFIICVVIAVCTSLILSRINK